MKLIISEKEIADRYNNYYKSKLKEPKILISQIFTYDRANIENANKKLQKGWDFKKIARKHSKAPEREQDGVIGWFSKGEALEVFDIAFDLEKGEKTGIIQSDYGFHIIKVLDRSHKRTFDFDEIKSYIINELVYEKENKLYMSWLKQKLENVVIIKNIALLNSIN